MGSTLLLRVLLARHGRWTVQSKPDRTCLGAQAFGFGRAHRGRAETDRPGEGKAKDTTTAFGVNGIISARATLADGQVLAYVQPTGATGLPILVSKTEAAKIISRNEVDLSGALGDGPFGFALLKVKDGPVTVTATKKALGAAEPCGADFFKDARALAGRYVQLTNVTFPAPKSDGSGKLKVKGDAGEVALLLPLTLQDREMPAGAVKVFGVPVRVEDEWNLMATRFLSVNNKANLALAMNQTCITCHNPDIKDVGPAYRDVAAKYKDDSAAKSTLLAQIKKGGAGRWGAVPMPPLGAKVPSADLGVLIERILGYRSDAIQAE